MAIRTYISIITLNVNGLNAPTKRHRLAEWIQKQDPYICCLQETHFTSRDTYKLKVRGWKKIFHANGNQKRWSNDTHIRQNRPENKEYDKRQRWALHNDQRTNRGSLQYIRQLLTTWKGEINNNTIEQGTLTPHLLQWTDHPDRKSTRKLRP